MPRVNAIAVLLSIVALISASRSAHAEVVLNDGGTTTLDAQVRDSDVAFPDNTTASLTPTTLPFVGEHTATIGGSTSHVTYNFSQSGFQIANTGTRAGALDSRANAQGFIYFSVTADTPYSLSGQIATVDPSAKYVEMAFVLIDVTTSTVLFQNEQGSFGVVDEGFTLGETEGNATNVLSGSLTGVLVAGHQYRVIYGNSLYAANAGSPATGAGEFSLAFVEENQTPDCSNAVASIESVWPPNHKFASVNIQGVTDPDGDPVSITIDGIYQDEPVDSDGKGKHVPDGKGVGTSVAQVRAERLGNGNGRVYHIEFTADDGNGGLSSGEVTVGVPHNQGQTPVDDGATFDSTGAP